ncbi:MAG TPA: NADPH:quinone reductase [Acidimicrobiales bacterium]|jgi:NADPH2:quinone reductase|nr:NADPH:quinone reductase [Acidimicrobiales bacterium]
MRAARYDRTGPAHQVLSVQDVERPDPGPGEVRVKVAVSGVNPTDWKSRAGVTGDGPDGWQIPHHDGAGEIDAVGPGVDGSRVGQRVWVWLAAAGRRWGTAAEWTVVPKDRAVPMPEGTSFELGASLGVPAMTAYHCLFADGPLDGTHVLVAGGAGAVGHFAIELAKHAGARVAATVSNDDKAELARRAGADLVVNYKAEAAADELRRFSATVDRVVEVALGANLDLDLAVAGPGTVISSYASEASDPTLPVRRCMGANLRLRFVLLYGVPAPALAAAAAGVGAALAAGALTELPVRRFRLDQVAAAQEAVEAGAVGKVLVEMG